MVRTLHLPGIIILFVIGVSLAGALVLNAMELVGLLIRGSFRHKEMIEKAFIMFLQIEIIAAIKIYFAQRFHFPLRFILYIGITDIIRHIIIELDDAQKVLLYAIALVLTIGGLSILELKNNWLERHREDRKDHFEL